MLRLIDLFCGVGGFSLGAVRAGFSVDLAIDWDPHAMAMHKINFPNSLHWETDIMQLTKKTLCKKFPSLGEIDGIIGGPPCQGFSRMGHQNIDDDRNLLFHKFFQIVHDLKPRFFLAENVLGILDKRSLPLISKAQEKLKDTYTLLPPIVIKASDFGIPTTRTRVFFYGYRPSLMKPLSKSDFLKLSAPGIVTVKDALYGLPNDIPDDWHDDPAGWRTVSKITKKSFFLKRVQGHIPTGIGDEDAIRRLNDQYMISGNQGTVHSKKVRKRYAALEAGECDVISKSRRLEPDGFCHTIRAGTGRDKGSFQAVRPIHPTESRVITPREAARLQSFPDWFQFSPTKWHSFRQIGNSVCPVLAEKILAVIRSAITEEA